MKKIIALLFLAFIIIGPLNTYGELTLEEKALVRNTVKNLNQRIEKVQEECEGKDIMIANLKEELEKECLDAHGGVLDKVQDIEKRLDRVEKVLEDN